MRTHQRHWRLPTLAFLCCAVLALGFIAGAGNIIANTAETELSSAPLEVGAIGMNSAAGIAINPSSAATEIAIQPAAELNVNDSTPRGANVYLVANGYGLSGEAALCASLEVDARANSAHGIVAITASIEAITSGMNGGQANSGYMSPTTYAEHTAALETVPAWALTTAHILRA
jgi:hypothetical protein